MGEEVLKQQGPAVEANVVETLRWLCQPVQCRGAKLDTAVTDVWVHVDLAPVMVPRQILEPRAPQTVDECEVNGGQFLDHIC